MKRFAVVALLSIAAILGACAGAPPEPSEQNDPLVLREGASWVRLDWTACGALPDFRTGEAQLEGRSYKLCWAALAAPAPHVLIVFDDGDVWRVSLDAFRRGDSASPPERGPRPHSL